MMIFFHHFLLKTFRNMKGNLFPNLTTIGIIGISLLLASTFSLIALNFSYFMKLWEEKIALIAYLKRETPVEEVEPLLTRIRELEGVESLKYVSPFDAMVFLENRLGEQKNLLEGIQPKILPSSIEIELKKDYRNILRIKELILKIKKIPQIEEVQYGQEWVEIFSAVVHVLKMTQWIFGGLLLAAIIFIISNTLQLAISSRKEEIEVMKMMGASPAFIQIPFYIEGLIQGLLGAGIAILLLYILYGIALRTVTPIIRGWMSSFPILFLTGETIGMILAGGMLLGLFGSFIATMRFLR
ncbi:MAG: cell division protein FtsX [Thermodesulfobacteriota bacterium]